MSVDAVTYVCRPEVTIGKAEKLLADGLELEFLNDDLDAARAEVTKAVPPSRIKAYQREIREQYQRDEPRQQMQNLRNCRVEQITSEQAKQVILKYEWLGTMGRSVATYGLWTPDDELIGASVFGWPSAVQSRDICGVEHRELAICLERGACVHWAPPNAASFLISQSVKQASRDHGWLIFYAYADPEAGEIGTVYQACNWLYIGQGVGRTPGRLREDWLLPDGSVLTSRSLRHKKMKRTDALAMGWTPVYKHPKHKYVHFEGTKVQRRSLLAALRYPQQGYPKRAAK